MADRCSTLTLDHVAAVLRDHAPQTGVSGVLSCWCGIELDNDDEYRAHLLAELAKGTAKPSPVRCVPDEGAGAGRRCITHRQWWPDTASDLCPEGARHG